MSSTIAIGHSVRVPFQINQTDLLAPTNHEMIAPVDGFVNAIGVIVQAAVTTGGAVKVISGASTYVDGATVTIANAAAKGTIYQATATAGSSTRAVTKGQRIQVAPAAAIDTAGAINGYVEFVTGK